MAKEDKAKVKMTVIHFETESDNATLQENIRAIAHTVSRALVSSPRPLSTSAQLPAGNGGTADPVAEVDEEEAIDRETMPSLSTSSASTKKGASRQYRTPQAVDLDLTSGDVPLRDFLEQKKPDSDIRRYLVIAYWLKKYRNIEEVTMDHAYTCYRDMGTGWQVPGDAAAPLRAMKGKQYGWMKGGSAKGAYVINHLGENEVGRMGN